MLAKPFGWNQTVVLPSMIYNCITMTSSMAIYKLFQDDANRTNVIYLTAIMTKLASIKDTLYELYKFKLCWNKKYWKIIFTFFYKKTAAVLMSSMGFHIYTSKPLSDWQGECSRYLIGWESHPVSIRLEIYWTDFDMLRLLELFNSFFQSWLRLDISRVLRPKFLPNLYYIKSLKYGLWSILYRPFNSSCIEIDIIIRS